MSEVQSRVHIDYAIRDIDRGINDLAIIAAPTDRTILWMKASLTRALLNRSQ